MEQQVVDVDDVAGLHEPLKTCRGTNKSHWSCNPLKLSQAGNGESRVGSGLGLEQHLPEAGGEVDS